MDHETESGSNRWNHIYTRTLGFCEIHSDLWTFFSFYNSINAFGLLCMIGRVFFDKTWQWVKKIIFHNWTTKKLSLKISDLDQDKLKIIVGGENSAFHLSGEKNSDLIKTWLYQNQLVQNGQVVRKETLETISMNRI